MYMGQTAEVNDFTADELAPDADQFDASEPIDMDDCEHCGDPSDDLYPAESVDESVGYRETLWLCSKCKPRKARGK